jgi:hypothetical protein
VHAASSESSSDAVGVRFHGPKWRPAIVMEPAPLRGTFGACSPLTAGAAVESTAAARRHMCAHMCNPHGKREIGRGQHEWTPYRRS